MSGKGLLAIGLAVIAAVFLALVIQTRSSESSEASRRRKKHTPVAVRADCSPAVDHAVEAAGSRVEDMFGAGARTRVREAATRLCQDDDWPTDVVHCLEGADDASALSRCVGELPPDAHSHLMAELERIPRAIDPPPPPPDPPPPADDDVYGTGTVGGVVGGAVGGSGWGPGMPDECLEYGSLIEKIASCDKLPQASRDAMRDAYKQMQSAWSGMATSDSAREAMATGCREATKAMKQAMTSLCP